MIRPSKKVVLTLAAGTMATAVAIGGIFAWFTSTGQTGDSEFKTAVVALETGMKAPTTISFYPGHAGTITAQKALEDAVVDGDGLAADADKNFSLWWDAHNKDFTEYLHEQHTTIPDANDGKVHFITSEIESVYNRVDNVTPGNFIYANYTATNTSTVPVYLRVKAAEVETDKNGTTPFVQTASIVWPHGDALKEEDGEPIMTLMVYGNDGYFYYPTPILPEDKNIEIMFAAYIPGAINGNDVQDTKIVLLGSGDSEEEPGMEIIQATNNAVSFADGWKDSGVTFEPYVPVE